MSDYVEIFYDSQNDDQSSKYPFRTIIYVYNGEEKTAKFYKKQPYYKFDSIQLENYFLKINKKKEIKTISNIISKYIGDERIINYTLNNKVNELHFDKEDEEYYFSNNKIKEMLNDKNDK